MSEQATRKIPTHYDQLFPGRFLKTGQLGGRQVTLRIRSVYVEPLPNVKGGDEDRGILSFDGTAKEMTINKVNGECLKAMFGPAVQNWVGKRITLMPDTDTFGRDRVDAIRIAGSPDITDTITVAVKYRKRRGVTRTLVPTGAARPSQPSLDESGEREPGEDEA